MENSVKCPEQQEYSDYLPTPTPDDAVRTRPVVPPPSLDTTREQILRGHYERQHLRRRGAGNYWFNHGKIFTDTEGGSISTCHLYGVFQELLEAAGLPKSRFHHLRHRSASLIINNDIPPIVVGRRFRHPKTRTTHNLYGHLLPSQEAKAAELIDDL